MNNNSCGGSVFISVKYLTLPCCTTPKQIRKKSTYQNDRSQKLLTSPSKSQIIS